MEPIEQLPFNKTVQYDNATISGIDCLVRTGTLPNTFDSLLNCLLQACSKKFVADSTENKTKSLNVTKNNIQRKYLQSSIFMDFHNQFLQSFHKLISDFYLYLSSKDDNEIDDNLKHLLFHIFKNNDQSLIDLYILICDIIPLNNSGIERIFKNCSKIWSCESNTDDLKNIFLKEVKKFLNYNEIFENIPVEKANYIKVNSIIMFDLMLQTIFTHLPSPDFSVSNINSNLLNTLKQYFKCNIIFVDSNLNLPFILNELTDELKTVFILSFDMKHFEVIGKLLQNNRIQREFTVNDSIFLKIQQMVTTNNNS